MKKKYTVIDHLGDDFDNRSLLERKKRLDKQIDEYIRLYALNGLSTKEESLIECTLIHLIELQRAYSAKLKLINAICLN